MAKIKPSVLVICVNMVFLSIFSPPVMSQSTSEVRNIKAIKKLSAEIEQYVNDHQEPDRKFMARASPEGRFSRESPWEWKEYKSEDEAEIFFERFNGYQEARVWLRDSHVVCVGFDRWSGSGDWFFYLKYLFDNQGRIIHIKADYRTAVDDIKVLDFQYFNKKGYVLDHVVEYYAIGWGGNQKLPEKPELMEAPIRDIPNYLKVSDLPFYSLLRTKPPKGNILLGENAWGE
jgi:hypothetical protein